jgi:hypothetical protein
VTYRLKARSTERQETSVARERLGKHVPAATDTQANLEELLEAVFSVLHVRGYIRSELVKIVIKLGGGQEYDRSSD